MRESSCAPILYSESFRLCFYRYSILSLIFFSSFIVLICIYLFVCSVIDYIVLRRLVSPSLSGCLSISPTLLPHFFLLLPCTVHNFAVRMWISEIIIVNLLISKQYNNNYYYCLLPTYVYLLPYTYLPTTYLTPDVSTVTPALMSLHPQCLDNGVTRMSSSQG